MAPTFVAATSRHLLVAILGTAALCASARALGVSPRLDLPSSSSIGIAPSTHWVDESGHVVKPAPAAVRAVLEVVVPTPSAATTAARVVCVAGAKGCSTSSTSSSISTTTAHDDDEPLIVVGKEDKTTAADGTDSKAKVFFVDEDTDEDAINDKKGKKKDKKTVGVPIIVSYDGWKGKTEDDIPISPNSRQFNTNYDMEHDYAGLSAPTHYAIRQQPNFKTVPTNDVPVTYWDVPLGSESLLVAHLVKSSLNGNSLHSTPPPPPPQYWRPSYDRGSPNWRSRGPNNHYPGVYRPFVNRRAFQPTPAPGFYGGMTPRVYSGYRPSGGAWCPPGSPSWPYPRPVYPTTVTTTTPKPVTRVNDKLDFDDSEEDKKDGEDTKGSTGDDEIKIIGKVELSDWK